MEKSAASPPLPSPQLERQPSIDSEPKTLLQNEMKLARKAALEVLKKYSKEEAQKIFLKGLIPVGNSKKEEEDPVVTDDDTDEE